MTLLKSSLQVGAIAAALLAMPTAWAQTANTTPAKKELIGRILKQQQPAIEQLTISTLTRPVNELAMKAGQVIRQAPADKREALAKSVDADLKKFMDDNGPALIEKGNKLVPSTMGALLDERFTEDELKQLAAWLESPVSKKFGQAAGELQDAFAKKLMEDNGKQLDERFTVLQQNIAKQLGVPANGQAPAAAPAPAAKPAPKK